MPWLPYFLNYPCNKKMPRNESAQNAIKFWHDFFSGIYKNFWHWKEPRGGALVAHKATRRGHPPRARQDALWAPQGPTHLSIQPTSSPTSRKKNLCSSLSLVFLLANQRFLISLLGAPFPKLFWGIAPSYVTLPLLQLVFALVDYILHKFLLLVLLKMSLHVEFCEFQVVWMLHIASRHSYE